jgi:hypothetical protein
VDELSLIKQLIPAQRGLMIAHQVSVMALATTKGTTARDLFISHTCFIVYILFLFTSHQIVNFTKYNSFVFVCFVFIRH